MSGKSELRMFDDALPQVVVENGWFVDISPSTSVTDETNKLDFYIYGSEGLYLDMNDTLLYIRYVVYDAKKQKLADTSTVYPTNFLMNALFSDHST